MISTSRAASSIDSLLYERAVRSFADELGAAANVTLERNDRGFGYVIVDLLDGELAGFSYYVAHSNLDPAERLYPRGPAQLFPRDLRPDPHRRTVYAPGPARDLALAQVRRLVAILDALDPPR